MKSYILIAILFVVCSLNACSSPKIAANNANAAANNADSAVKPEDTPLAIDLSAKIENGQIVSNDEFSTVLPKDWIKLGIIGYRSPSYNSDDHQFANFSIDKYDDKTEFTELPPDEALKRFKEKKKNQATQPMSYKFQSSAVENVKVQSLTIDNVPGVYSETVYRPHSDGTQEFDWRWTTFLHSKDKSYEIRIDLGGDSRVKEQCKPVFDAIINSLKIRRLPSETFPESKPQ